MERDIESCIECYEETESGSPDLNHIIDDINELYKEQLKKAQDAPEGTLQLQVKTLQHWVSDLTEQNKMLVKTVEELEGDALRSIENPNSARLDEPGIKTSKGPSSTEMNSLLRELEETKKQLNEKISMEVKHQNTIEELKHIVEKERTKKITSEPKLVIHRSSMTDFCDSSITAFHYELEATKLKLAESEKEVIHLKTKLSDAEANISDIRTDLCNTEKNARDMTAALTAEVAEKHDQILALKREVSHLEDQLRQADKQTHFKDDIIKKLREDVKVARSKETLAEVLGITEKSLSSKMKIDQLKQQLENKEQQIIALEERINSINSPSNGELIKKVQEQDRKLEAAEAAFCRIRQQLEWFTNNILQQCHQASVTKQFESHLQTQLGELHESLKYSDFDVSSEDEPSTPESPLSSGTDLFTCKGNLSSKTVTILPAKSVALSVNSQWSETKKLKSEIREQAVEIARLEDTLDQTSEQLLALHASSCRNYYQQDPTSIAQRLMELQKEVEEAHTKMIQSWSKLRDMSQQMGSRGIKSELEQYKICATKEQSTLSRLQTEINTLLAKLANRELQANRMTQLIESLRDHLIVVQNQLQQGLNIGGHNLQSWIKTLQESLSAAQSQLQEIERTANLVKGDREEFRRTYHVEETIVKSLQQELHRIQQARLRAFEKLCQAEKSQRDDWNHLVNTVVHHHDLCKQEQVASDDMKQEINQLVTSLSAKSKQLQSQEETIQNLQQTLTEAKAQNQRFHKRRSVTFDTDVDDEGYHTLAKTQQEVETLRHMVNMRDRQILEKEQKINALKKVLSKTRSDVRGGRFPSRVSVAPSMCKVGEVEEYKQQALHIQAIVSRIQMEVISTFNEMEYRDHQLNRLIDGLQKALDLAQQEFNNDVMPSQEAEDDKAVILKSAMSKCQKSIKHFIKKTLEFTSYKDRNESSRNQLQSRLNNLHAELEAAQDDLLAQLQSVSQEENLNANTSTAEVKLENLQFELEQNKIKMLEMEGLSKSAEEKNKKLKQDLAKAQEELSRVRSLPTWKKTTLTATDNFKLSSNQITFAEMEQNLMLKENAMVRVQEELVELNWNLQSRDKVIQTQQETIQVLQNSLKLEHEESEELRKKVIKLESLKDTVKTEYQQKIEELESTVSSLHDTRKKSDEASLRMKEGVSVLCKIMFSELKEQYHQFYQEAIKETESANAHRDANIELATLCGHLQQEYHRSQEKLTESYFQRSQTEKKHQQAIGAMQIVICNLNEKLKARDVVINSRTQEIQKLVAKVTKQDDIIAKCETKIQCLQEEIMQRDKEVTSLNSKMDEFETTTIKNQELSEFIAASKKDQKVLQKKINELNDELYMEKEKSTKLSLEMSLAANEVQRESKLNGIHKQRLTEVTEALDNKSEELKEKEGIISKLHGALTHLSLKVVSNIQNLEHKESLLKDNEEQLAQLQSALQEKLNQEEMKDKELQNLKKNLEKLRSQLDIEQKKHHQLTRKDSMIELLESKVEQLTVELESCKYTQNRDSECVAALLREKAEEMTKKEEDIIALQMQLKKCRNQRDKLEAELNLEHEKLLKLQDCNSTQTYNLKQLEHSKNQLLIELESMKKLVDDLRHELRCHNESADLELKHHSQQIVDNAQHCISEQRQFSISLASQLRYTKQELKAIKQENRMLVESVKCLKTTNRNLEKELRALQSEGLDSASAFDLTHVHRTYELENFRTKSNTTLDEQPLVDVKLKAGRNSTHTGLSSTSNVWQLSSGETDKSEYKNWKRRIQNLAQSSTVEDSKESIYYSSST